MGLFKYTFIITWILWACLLGGCVSKDSSILMLPQDNPPPIEYRENNASISPDGKYAIESQVDEEKHIYQVILYENNREKAASTFDIVGRDFNFLWSPDSKKVCVNYSGRIWSDFSIVDVETKALIEPPSMADIIKRYKAIGASIPYELNEDRPDPYRTPFEWSPEGGRLLVFYQFFDTETKAQNGAFVYDVEGRRVSDLYTYSPAEGEHAPIKRPEGFKW